MDCYNKEKSPFIQKPLSILALEMGREIYRLRKQRGMSGKQLAEKLKVSQQQISRYERGICHMTIDTLIFALYHLDENLDNFFFEVWKRVRDKNVQEYTGFEDIFKSLGLYSEFNNHFESNRRFY